MTNMWHSFPIDFHPENGICRVIATVLLLTSENCFFLILLSFHVDFYFFVLLSLFYFVHCYSSCIGFECISPRGLNKKYIYVFFTEVEANIQKLMPVKTFSIWNANFWKTTWIRKNLHRLESNSYSGVTLSLAFQEFQTPFLPCSLPKADSRYI